MGDRWWGERGRTTRRTATVSRATRDDADDECPV